MCYYAVYDIRNHYAILLTATGHTRNIHFFDSGNLLTEPYILERFCISQIMFRLICHLPALCIVCLYNLKFFSLIRKIILTMRWFTQ